MKIAIGSDEKHLTASALLEAVRQRNDDILLFGPLNDDDMTWPAVARQVAESVANGEAEEGILFCWTGTGVSIAANKVPGIRAALCADAETARGARLWNDANILCLSLRHTSIPVMQEILTAWFATRYEPNPEDDACLRQITRLDQDYRPHS